MITRPHNHQREMAILAALLLFFASCFYQTYAMANENKLIIAHRGASGYLPEHTLAAKAMAHAMGADYIEQDVVLSKDGVAVVLHDIHLETVTDVLEKFSTRMRDDGRFYVIDFTLSELKTLRVNERTRRGSKDSVYPGRFPQSTSNFTIPTLVEEIELIQGLNKSTGRDVGIYPEIKAPKFHHDNGHDLAKIVLDILARYGYQTKSDAVILQCFNWEETKRIRKELGYKGKMVQLLGENNWGISPQTDYTYLKSNDGLKEMAGIVDGIGPWINQIVTGTDENGKPVISQMVSNARDFGLAVHPYTARADQLPNWATSFDNLLDVLLNKAGASGIFTDFPDLAVRFINTSN